MTEPLDTRRLIFINLGWGDAEAAELRLALQYAAAKCAFPKGAVAVWARRGNPISEEARATLPPPHGGDYSAESVHWGAPGDARPTGARRATRGTRGRASSSRPDA